MREMLKPGWLITKNLRVLRCGYNKTVLQQGLLGIDVLLINSSQSLMPSF